MPQADAKSTHRGMGGNQAMCDTADMLPQLVKLKAIAAQRKPRREDYVEALETYERAMIPRAFGWVRKSGGTGQRVSGPSELVDHG